MPHRLDEYLKKRDGALTNEPMPDGPERAIGPTWRGTFVIHQHDATRMHWDLRLEVSGVLASFAVPRGPSLDPDARNLAVRTEDHPIEYLDFEAVIPANTYGAGPMIVWDWGVVRYLDQSAEEGLEIGKLHFSLEGKKVRGRFGLVRMKPKGARGKASAADSHEWLLLKKRDAFVAPGSDVVVEQPRSVLSGLTVAQLAERADLERRLEDRAAKLGAPAGDVDGRGTSPMLATLGELPTGAGWLYELKLDGVRIVATKDEDGVELRYRSGRVATHAYPEVARAVAALPAARVVLDGEVVAFDEAGKPRFDRLAQRIHASPRTDLRRALFEVPVTFVVFDLLALGHHDLMPLPLLRRKELLAGLVPAAGVVRVLDHLSGHGDRLFAFCRENGLEGVVSKRADSPYRPGQRTDDWIKTKCDREERFVVVGYTPLDRGKGPLGSLDLGTFEGGVLRFRGKVGSGLSAAMLDDLLSRLAPLAVPEPSAQGEYDPAPRGRTHVRPEVVVRVRFLEWSEGGHLRHPVFLGLEHDADPLACTAHPHAAIEVGDEAEARPEASSASRGAAEVDARPIQVRITNRDKLFWPEEGITKGELVAYYDAIAPTMLPYLADRPVMLVRYPDGIGGKSFYQWNVPHGTPPWLRSVALGKHVEAPTEEDQKKHVFLVDRREALVFLANLACIPIHVLGSRVTTPQSADFLTIDFDVKLSSLGVAVTLAHTLRELLTQVGLVGFPKTSGQTGLHVLVPLGAGVTPSASRTLADLLGRLVCERHPQDATMERTVQKRGPRVYVDTGQTGPSRTIVAPWSVRASPGARVSTPLSWDEVVPDLDPSRFTIRTVLSRAAEGPDPMAGLLTERPDLQAVLRGVGALLGRGG